MAPDGHQLAQVPHPLHSDALMWAAWPPSAVATSSGAWNWQMSTHSPQARQRSSSTWAGTQIDGAA